MRTSIVLKLFLLTTGLCLFVIASIFIGQTVFFEQYVHQKVEKVQEALQSYRQNELAHAGASQDEARVGERIQQTVSFQDMKQGDLEKLQKLYQIEAEKWRISSCSRLHPM